MTNLNLLIKVFLEEVYDYIAGGERKEEAKTTPPVDNRKKKL
jgi:hypothetical protein